MQLSQGPFSYNRFDAVDAAYKALYEKKADKDYDGDGKVESSKAEYFGSKDKAIKKAMGKTVKEGKGEMPDFIKKKIEDKKGGEDKKEGKKEKCECKEDVSVGHVMQYLIDNQLCTNEVSAEVMYDHMSEAMLNSIVNEIIDN